MGRYTCDDPDWIERTVTVVTPHAISVRKIREPSERHARDLRRAARVKRREEKARRASYADLL